LGASLNTAQYICDQNHDLSYIRSDIRYFYKMAMLEENRELRDKINEAIGQIKSSTELYDLMNTYIANYATAPSTAVNAHEGWPTYRVGVTGNVPPLDYIAADGTASGFNVAILNLIGEKIGVNFEYVSLEANARTTALCTGKIDLIFCENIADDDAVAEFAFEDKTLLLTDYYYSDTSAFVTKDFPQEQIREIYGIEETKITTLADLAGKKVSAGAGTMEEAFAKEKLPDSEIISIPAESLFDDMSTLLNGTINAHVKPLSYLSNLAHVRILSESLGSIEECFALPMGQLELAAAMEEVIAGFEADGTLAALHDKWFKNQDLSAVNVEAETDYDAPNGSLNMVVLTSFPPNVFNDGTWKGYDYELALLIGKELGYAIQPVVYDQWQAAMDDLIAGEVDMLPCVTYTKERAEKMLLVKNGDSDEVVVAVYDND